MKSVIIVIISLLSLSIHMQAGRLNPSFGTKNEVKSVAFIQSKVWNDANLNGVMDANEEGIKDVKVMLVDAFSGTIVSEVSSDENGIYTFNNIEAGHYLVAFATPNGYLVSAAGQDENKLGNKNLGGITEVLEIKAGDFVTNLNSGFYTDTKLGLIN